MTESSTNPAIAIVGMSMWSPGAHSLQGFWENVLARRMQFRKFPDSRMSLADYWSADADDVDKTYADRGAFMDGFEFDWVGRRIPERTFKSTDIAHWLALETALGALEDAGYSRGSVPTGRSATIVGNSLTGEESRMWSMRLRWPYVKRALRVAADARQLDPTLVEALAETMEDVYKGPLPEPSEDTLAGVLSNTIAGRICNYLDFNGGGYVVDGACASGMLAVATAADKLADGTADFVLAGGVDVSMDPLELVGFARLGALTHGDMNVYDARRSGFIPGEGCGFVALKRLDDARAAGDYVYATIRGWGISTDGKGGITKPRAETQAEMIRRAYAGAGFGASDVDFVEGHGTGTPVGDPVELTGIQQAALSDGPASARSIGMTSLKSLIGHTKAASGILALIKATMAVNQRILPPIAGCVDPNPAFATEAPSLFPLINGEIRESDSTLRAGAQAMGFGGINAHVALESADAPSSKLAPAGDVRMMLASYQDSEVFVLSASSAVELATKAREVAAAAVSASIAELVDLSAKLAHEIDPSAPLRAAVVAGRPAHLAERMNQVAEACESSAPTPGQVQTVSNEVSISNSVRHTIGFVFPGQGAQQLEMARVLIERFDWARELADQADLWLEEVGAGAVTPSILRNPVKSADAAQLAEWKEELARTQITQPAVALASLLWLEYLRRLGIEPAAVAGHSLGELAALYAAGAYGQKTLITLAAAKGAAMAVSGDGNGAMASLACDRSAAESIVGQARGYATVANLNTPTQTVISGTADAIEEIVEIARSRGISTQALAVSNAFHSELMNDAVHELKSTAPVEEKADDLTCAFYSCVEGERMQVPFALRELVTEQVVSPVDWVKTTRAISSEVDLLIEVGPGRVLTGLTTAVNGRDGVRCLPVASKAGRDEDFNVALAAMFVHGAQIHWDQLFAGRFVRDFVPAEQKKFIGNLAEATLTASSTPEPLAVASTGSDPAAALADYLSRRGNFLVDVIRADVGSGVTMGSPTPTPTPAAPAAPAAVPVAPAPVAKSPAAAPPAAPTSGGGAEAELVRILASTTGFPADSITPDLRLLDDLNLDSISAAEAISKVAQQFGAADLDPAEMANATIAEAAALIRAASPDAADASAAGGGAQSTVSTLLLGVIAEDTGFPVESLDLDLHLLDDLNMDSIKAADAIATVATQLGVESDLDPAELVNVSLGELIEVLGRSARRPAASASPKTRSQPVEKFTWVRDFVLDRVAAEAPAGDRRDLTGTSFTVVGDGDSSSLAGEVETALRSRGADVRRSTFADAAAAEPDHVVAVLPRATDAAVTQEFLRSNIDRMHSIVPAQVRGGDRRTTLAVVHVIDDEQASAAPSAAAFAASIHHERTELDVRVIGVHRGVSDAVAAGAVVSELDSTAPYVCAEYDAHLTRTVLQPRVLSSGDYSPREHGLGVSDVVVVTGGAKGIMAQCALALGRATGATLALVGSSERRGGDEIDATLADFASAGLEAHYFRCDVTDPDAVAGVVTDIESELGAITGFVHGAGANVPRRFERVDSAAAFAEVAPKVLGAANFVDALAGRELKVFVGFSSIIGFTGMPGNSWYAYGNEILDEMVARYASEHPATRTFSLAYSVWGETGMGARMGSVNHLAKMGVMPISTADGVEHFLRLLSSGPDESRIVVTSRLGGLDTWAPSQPARPAASRYIDHVVTFEPHVELVTRTRLSVEADPFVLDHVWKGSALLPTVFGLEAMAQAAAYLTGRVTLGRVRIDDIRLDRPIVVDPESGTHIEIRAAVVDADAEGTRVRVTIGTERTGYDRPHFSADFTLGLDETVPTFERELPAAELDIDPLDDLYSWLLFQEGQFRRLEKITSLDSEHILFEAGSRPDPAQHLLVDPYFLDSMLQSGQVMVPREICLPVFIARIDLYDGRFENGSLTAYGYDRVQTATHMQADLAVVQDGRVLVQLEGYRSQILSHDDTRPTAEEIADPTSRDAQIILDKLARHSRALGVKSPRVVLAHTPGIHELTKSERHEQERPIAEAAVTIHLDEDAVMK